MSLEKMREEFEAFHRKHLSDSGMHPQDIASEFDRKEDGSYIYALADDGWKYWQASRAAVVVLPKEADFAASDDAHFILGQCREAIEAAGMKVAP